MQAAPRQRSASQLAVPPKLDAPRAGSAEAKDLEKTRLSPRVDAPRAGSAEAKGPAQGGTSQVGGCTPCRQRRGKDRLQGDSAKSAGCTPCRQRRGKVTLSPKDGRAAARCTPRRQRRGKELEVVAAPGDHRDAPRAGSGKQNNNVPPDGPLTTGRHFFTFHPSRILMLSPSSSVTMYNPVPIFLTEPAWRSKIFPTVPMLSVTGRLRGYAWCGESPWG